MIAADLFTPPPGLLSESGAPTPLALAAAGALGLLVTGAVLLGTERRGFLAVIPLIVLTALALAIANAPFAAAGGAPLVAGLVAATLARDRRDPLHAECALKVLWVIGPALALSWAGLLLLTLTTGTPVPVEQWAVLGLGLDPRFLWITALPLALLAGLVLLGGAPFHFMVADLLQGVRPWLAASAVVALQVSGATWLSQRLEGVIGFYEGRELVRSVLGFAAFAALGTGAVTLLVQRRPERRVGTLASLNGGLMLVVLATGRTPEPADLAAWAGHLALAVAGAATVARFLPTFAGQAPGAPLFRRHPWTGIAGLYALASLAGVPGTPGASLWLASARSLAAGGRTELLLVLAAAWLATLTAAMRQWRQAFGVAPLLSPRDQAALAMAPQAAGRVPLEARIAMWISALGLVALGAVRLWRG
jgi:NADH:ubiquinone oxidoreductase subunit 2 (subunit N)